MKKQFELFDKKTNEHIGVVGIADKYSTPELLDTIRLFAVEGRVIERLLTKAIESKRDSFKVKVSLF